MTEPMIDSNQTTGYTLAELMIVAAADVFADSGEVLATGIGVLQRLAASLAMRTVNPDLMMTDSEAWLLSEPNPVSGRKATDAQKQETWMGFSRVFDNVWSGRRHALVGPSQIDRFGQTNISALGDDYRQPKVQMLGVRGFPGNSISHINSFMVPSHGVRSFVAGECDTVCSIGYNPARLPRGYSFDDIHVGRAISNLCVIDWQGPDHSPRIRSLHPGVSVEEVQANTGFALHIEAQIPLTRAPTPEQLAIIAELDPLNLRAKQLKDNPAGDRRYTG